MKLDDRKSGLAKLLDRFIGVPLLLLLTLVNVIVRVFLRPDFRLGGNSPPKRILCIKISALGDAVVLLPAVACLQKSFPKAEIDFLGGSSNAEFLKYAGVFRQVYIFGRHAIGALLFSRYDLVVDFEQWMRASSLVSLATFSSASVGFRSPSQHRHFGYTKSVALDFQTHMGRSFWNLAAVATGSALGELSQSEFESDRLMAQRKFQEKMPEKTRPERFALFHPGCGAHGIKREWPVSSWIELIERFVQSNPGVKVYLTGHGEYEHQLVEKTHRGIAANHQASVIPMVGRLGFEQLLTWLRQAEVVVCGNTGVMHLASLVGAELFALHGPTSPVVWGPLWEGCVIASKLECAPCLTWGYDYGCHDPVCVKSITAQKVARALQNAQTT